MNPTMELDVPKKKKKNLRCQENTESPAPEFPLIYPYNCHCKLHVSKDSTTKQLSYKYTQHR